MFVQNQIADLPNHFDVIQKQANESKEIRLIVAYVRENGVDIILDKIKNKPTKLLCSLDMGITQLSGIKKLLENGVDVKVYHSNEGTFHPKIWLFGENKKKWKMLIGSANLTRAAFLDNVEASVLVEEQSTITNALMFFNYLWDKENSSSISIEDIHSLQQKIIERKTFKNKPTAVIQKEEKEKLKVLFEYVKSWIDIPEYSSKGISRIWRGWYIIPDQGWIDNTKISNLQSYLQFIDEKDGLKLKSDDVNYQNLLAEFKKRSSFQRNNLKTNMHGLFVRQAKIYLAHFGWVYHPIKNNGKAYKQLLKLTSLGEEIKKTNNIQKVKELYTDYFLDFSYNGLKIVPFTQKILAELEYISLEEFDYFIIHTFSDEDLFITINLIKIYRSLTDEAKEKFRVDCQDYFKKIKEPTAKSVYGNYLKSIKHTISVIAWCEGFQLDGNLTLRQDSENR